MRDNGKEIGTDDSLAGLKRYCLCLVEFISGQATDPHLYFQNKYTADVSSAQTLAEVLQLLEHLADCVHAAGVEASALTRLDELLNDRDLPSLSLLKQSANRELLRILASGRVATEEEYRLVRASIDEVSDLSDTDRTFGKRLAVIYESEK